MTRLHNPLRDVVHIEIARRGRNGAEPWILTLSCGHIAARSRSNTRPVTQRMCRPLRFAPKRCRCLLCGELERDRVST